jgi:hypothetical protein
MDKHSRGQLNHAFFTQDNIELLWELIADEYRLTNAKTQIMQEYKLGIRNVFDTNLQAFKAKVFDQELMTLNKTFLAQINAAVRNLYPDIREHLKKTKIKIIEPVQSTLVEPIMDPISHQDIQMKRRSEFNQRLDLQQQNLDMALGVAQKPADIDLSDQLPPEDKDPQSIAEQFARTLAERNYDPMPLPLPLQSQAKQSPKKNITIDERHNQVNEYQTQPFDNGSGSDSDPDTEFELNSNNAANNINNNGQIIEMLHTVTDLLQNVMDGMKILNEKIDKLK